MTKRRGEGCVMVYLSYRRIKWLEMRHKMIGEERTPPESFWRLRSGETGVHSSRAIDQEPDAGANAPYVSNFQDTVTALPLPFLLFSALN